MTKRGKRAAIIGLLAVLGVALVSYGLVAMAAGSYNLYQEHLITGTKAQSSCSGYVDGQPRCHDLGSRLTLDAHRTHKSPMFLAFYDKASGAGVHDGCGRCHEATDISEESGAKLRRQAEPSDDTHFDPQVACLNCHGTGATTSTHLTKGVVDASGNILQPYGCLQNGCHMEGHPGIGTMAPVSAHSNCTWISQPYASARAYCTKCHGGLGLFATSESNPKP